MFQYNFDKTTKAFRGKTEAQIDQMVTKNNQDELIKAFKADYLDGFKSDLVKTGQAWKDDFSSEHCDEWKGIYLERHPLATTEELNVRFSEILENNFSDYVAKTVNEESRNAPEPESEDLEAVVVCLSAANATLVEPPAYDGNYIPVFDENAGEGSEWSIKEDHRGAVVYHEITGEEKTINDVGEIPAEFSVSKPDLSTADKLREKLIKSAVRSTYLDIYYEPDADLLAAMTIPELKSYVVLSMNHRFNHAMNWVLADYCQAEIDSFSEQKSGCDLWAANRSIDGCGILKDLAKGKNLVDDTGLTEAMIDDYSQSVLAKADYFNGYAGGLIGLKKSFKSRMDLVSNDYSGEVDEQHLTQQGKDKLKALKTSDILGAGIAYLFNE